VSISPTSYAQLFHLALYFFAHENWQKAALKLSVKLNTDGIPFLNVNFGDGRRDDSFILKPFDPIPSDVGKKNVDNCIFTGHLRDETEVLATLTGGCPFEKSFEVFTKAIEQLKV
jgi:hypothetical protein